MRNVLFGLMACATLLAVSCETTDTASDDSLYETQSIDRNISKKNIRA